MLGAFVGAAVGAFLASRGSSGRTIERHTVYRDVDYDKLARKTVDALLKEDDERRNKAILSRINELEYEKEARGRTCAYCGKEIVCDKFCAASSPFTEEPIKARFVFRCDCMQQEVEYEWPMFDRVGEPLAYSRFDDDRRRISILRQVLMVDDHGWKNGNAIRNCSIFHELFNKAYSLWYTLSAQDEHDGVSAIDDEIEALKLQLKSPASIEDAQSGVRMTIEHEGFVRPWRER